MILLPDWMLYGFLYLCLCQCWSHVHLLCCDLVWLFQTQTLWEKIFWWLLSFLILLHGLWLLLQEVWHGERDSSECSWLGFLSAYLLYRGVLFGPYSIHLLLCWCLLCHSICWCEIRKLWYSTVPLLILASKVIFNGVLKEIGQLIALVLVLQCSIVNCFYYFTSISCVYDLTEKILVP